MQILSVPYSLQPVTLSRPPRLAESILVMEVARAPMLQRDSEAMPRKKRKPHLYVTSVIKQIGRSIRLYVTVVADKLLLGNFGYKAV